MIRPVLFCMLMALLLTGCAHSPPTRLFTLEAIESETVITRPALYSGPPIRVRAVHIPPALDRTELVFESAPGELTVADFEHWAAPLGLTARQVLTQDLVVRLPPGLLAASDAALPAGGVDLQVDILSFGVSSGTAEMQVSWSAVSVDPKVGRKQSAFLKLQAPADGVGGKATALGLSRLIAQLADHIVADTIQK